MEMAVEIYDQREIVVDGELQIRLEDDERALALIDEMGLTGQQQINTPSSGAMITIDSDEPVRNGFEKVSRMQQIVINNLFPTHCEIEKYDNGCIPLRVLETARECRKLFTYVYVCYAPPAELVDPILVAVNKEWSTWSSSVGKDAFMIARWGDALMSWVDLFAEAKAKKCLEIEEALTDMVAAAKYQLQRIKGGAVPEDESLDGSVPSFHYMPFSK